MLVLCEYCEGVGTERKKPQILGLNGIQAFKLSESINIFNFLIINLTARLSGGKVMMIPERLNGLIRFFSTGNISEISEFERCFMRQQAKIVSPSSAIMSSLYFQLPLLSTAC